MINISHQSHASDPGQITLIDLEPKSVAKLSQWEKLDATIVQTYAGMQEKVCIDAWKPVRCPPFTLVDGALVNEDVQ